MKIKRQHYKASHVKIKRKGNSQIELIFTEYREKDNDWSKGTEHEIHIEMSPCWVRRIANDLWRIIEGWQDEIERMMTALKEGQ